MALSQVAHTSQTGSGVTSITTPAINTTTASLVVVDVSYYAPFANFLSITDSVGLTWSESIAENTADADILTRQRYGQNPTGNASHTFTYNAAGTDYPSMAVKAIAGAATSSVLAETNTVKESTNGTSHTLSLTTSAQANCFLCGFGGSANTDATDTMSQTGSFTNDDRKGDTGSSMGIYSSHLIISATGSNTFSFTTTNSTVWRIAIAAFKAGATTTPKTFSATDVAAQWSDVVALGFKSSLGQHTIGYRAF